MKKQLKGSLLLVLATVIWGSAFVSQSIGMDHIGPFTFQAARCMLAFLGLLPITLIADLLKKEKKGFLRSWFDKKLWKAGILCGLPLFLACNLQQMGLVDTDAGKSGFLTAMYIVIVPVIGIFLKKKPTIMVPISVGTAVVGLYCLSCVGVTRITTGDLLTLGCALMFAIQITLVDIFAKDIDALRLNAIQALVCGVLSAVGMLFTEQPDWNGIRNCMLPLAHAGLLSMGLAYYLQIVSQKNVDTAPAALIMSLESVFAAIFGTYILKETMTIWELIGSCLIFVAVILSQLPIKLKKTVHPSH